ncbi:MAG TPA: amidohydrolase [Acidobacteriota bacterium]|nr:amidohydrolase [Acidobacteriota bacterium]
MIAALLALGGAVGPIAPPILESPETILHGGRIYTVDVARPWAEAMAIEAGKIVAVGDDTEVLGLRRRTTEIIDLDGRMVLPGFHDPHVHVVEGGVNERLCLLPWRRPLATYEQSARNCANRQQSRDWVVGAGVFLSTLLEGDELPIDVLDRAVPDRPALILDDLGHGAWANTLAMAAAEYGKRSPDPAGGLLHRDAGSGRLTGIVFENAQQKLRDAAWPPTDENLEETYQGLIGSLAELNMHGITSVSDAGGYWTRGHHDVWARAEGRGELTVRASNALYVSPDRPFEAQMADLRRLYANEPGSLLRFNQAKIYIDGILDLGTSALLNPYLASASLPSPSPSGFVYFEQHVLQEYVRALDEIGFQMHLHATGDRGVRLALDALEAARARNGAADRRHRVSHLYLVDEEDRPRFLELGVIADLQMPPDAINRAYARYVSRLVGDDVAGGLLPVQSLLDAGAKTVLSSDWDAGPLSPLGTIQRALTRFAEPVGTLAGAIRMLTLDAAFLLHQADITGSIMVGKQADLVVLERNLFDIPKTQIEDVRVLLTLLNGEKVFRAGGF